MPEIKTTDWSETWSSFRCPECDHHCWVQHGKEDMELVKCWQCETRFWTNDVSASESDPEDVFEHDSQPEPD